MHDLNKNRLNKYLDWKHAVSMLADAELAANGIADGGEDVSTAHALFDGNVKLPVNDDINMQASVRAVERYNVAVRCEREARADYLDAMHLTELPDGPVPVGRPIHASRRIRTAPANKTAKVAETKGKASIKDTAPATRSTKGKAPSKLPAEGTNALLVYDYLLTNGPSSAVTIAAELFGGDRLKATSPIAHMAKSGHVASKDRGIWSAVKIDASEAEAPVPTPEPEAQADDGEGDEAAA